MKYVHTNDAPEAIGPYSQAILEQKTLYTSGQLGIDPKTQDFISNDIEGQTKQVLKNIEAILKSTDFKVTDICKVTIYLKDLSVFSVVNRIYQDFFKDHKPARSTIEVSRLPKDGLIEIDVIAQKSWHRYLNLLQFLMEAIICQKQNNLKQNHKNYCI